MRHCGKYIESNRAQIPQRITDELIKSSTCLVENYYRNSGYQARHLYKAAIKWAEALDTGKYVWLGMSGAATPVGIGGLVADAMRMGLIDAMVLTGANTYHDLHFPFALPIRQGSANVNDDELKEDGTTRIYNQNIDNERTLKTQDAVNQIIARRVIPRLPRERSSGTLLYELGKEMLNDNSGMIVDKKGSLVITAAEFDVPLYWDSQSNHSFAMDMAPLRHEGLYPDTSPSLDLDELTGFCLHTQPQLNVFFGEGGPRNLIQTLGPYANEIAYIDFEGSDGCIRFTTSDVRAGALSGSSQSEAVTWNKYPDASPEREVEVWSEYTITIPLVLGYVAAHTRDPRRLMLRREEFHKTFVDKFLANRDKRTSEQERLIRELPEIQRREIEARKRAGYEFE